jgi:hypothetical protein
LAYTMGPPYNSDTAKRAPPAAPERIPFSLSRKLRGASPDRLDSPCNRPEGRHRSAVSPLPDRRFGRPFGEGIMEVLLRDFLTDQIFGLNGLVNLSNFAFLLAFSVRDFLKGCCGTAAFTMIPVHCG